MKFSIPIKNENFYTIMRRCGYAPEEQDGKTGEWKFHKALSRGTYPRFHVYGVLSPDKERATLNLHLDQKQPSYQGSHAHSGEYEGPLVENEAERIQNTVRP